VLAASCGITRRLYGGDGQREMVRAVAEIRGYSPNNVHGTIEFTPNGTKGLRIQGNIKGLLPDHSYGIHLHENGNCSSPDAVGPHFDPGLSNQHGRPGQSPGASHAGDLPNLETGNDGSAKLDYTTNALGVEGSDFSVIGRSIVVHAFPDDYTTQPSGNAGEPIACGVIVRVR